MTNLRLRVGPKAGRLLVFHNCHPVTHTTDPSDCPHPHPHNVGLSLLVSLVSRLSILGCYAVGYLDPPPGRQPRRHACGAHRPTDATMNAGVCAAVKGDVAVVQVAGEKWAANLWFRELR